MEMSQANSLCGRFEQLRGRAATSASQTYPSINPTRPSHQLSPKVPTASSQDFTCWTGDLPGTAQLEIPRPVPQLTPLMPLDHVSEHLEGESPMIESKRKGSPKTYDITCRMAGIGKRKMSPMNSSPTQPKDESTPKRHSRTGPDRDKANIVPGQVAIDKGAASSRLFEERLPPKDSDQSLDAGGDNLRETDPDDFLSKKGCTPEEKGHRRIFENYGSHKARREINHRMLKCLKNKRKASPSEPGWVYMLKSPGEVPDCFKIGMTDQTPEVRKRLWEKCEGLLSEVSIGNVHGDAFCHYFRVETLIKLELHNQRRKHKCSICSKWHEEWYAIDVELGLKIIQRWKTWIAVHKPYDSDGNLKEYWVWKVDKLLLTLNDVNWDEFTQPKWNSHFNDYDYYCELYGKDYYRPVKAHLRRKDSHFFLVGIIIVLLAQIFGGWSCLALAAVALLLL